MSLEFSDAIFPLSDSVSTQVEWHPEANYSSIRSRSHHLLVPPITFLPASTFFDKGFRTLKFQNLNIRNFH